MHVETRKVMWISMTEYLDLYYDIKSFFWNCKM